MRRAELIVNLAFVFGLPVLALFMVAGLALAPVRIPGILMCLALYAGGVSLLFRAKLPQYRQGIWFRFGPSRMSAGDRARYQVAYALLIVGALLNLMLLISTLVPE